MTGFAPPKFEPRESRGAASAGAITIILATLLFCAAGITGWIVIHRMHDSLRWVLHTYEVRGQIRQARMAALDMSGRVSSAVATNDPQYLEGLAQDFSSEMEALAVLYRLTGDNASQQARLNRLQPIVATAQGSVGACRNDLACLPPSPASRKEVLQSLWDGREQSVAILDDMEHEEDGLLRLRLNGWSSHFQLMILVLASSFVAAVLLMIFNFRQLLGEAAGRYKSDQLIREHVDSYRALSGRILELQDAERRRIARELHDSVGQYLAGVRLQLQQLERLCPQNSQQTVTLFSETRELVDRSLTEVRTISHLLHPPLLDELGLYSAARWYVEGFAKRSEMDVSFLVDDFTGRLHRDSEIALFRVLQEALTNVHRHSSAKTVLVKLRCKNGIAVLLVEDNGRGIPSHILRRFQEGHGGGIGLAGMRERLADLRGTLQVHSDPRGTLIQATIPANACLNGEVEAVEILKA